jgi:flavin-binding protein dodecin
MGDKNMAIIKIRELIGTSEKSFDEALENLIEQQVKAGKNLTGARVLNQSVEVKEGKITEYKVNAKVAYKWEE